MQGDNGPWMFIRLRKQALTFKALNPVVAVRCPMTGSISKVQSAKERKPHQSVGKKESLKQGKLRQRSPNTMTKTDRKKLNRDEPRRHSPKLTEKVSTAANWDEVHQTRPKQTDKKL
jgi:hypothetical protein